MNIDDMNSIKSSLLSELRITLNKINNTKWGKEYNDDDVKRQLYYLEIAIGRYREAIDNKISAIHSKNGFRCPNNIMNYSQKPQECISCKFLSKCWSKNEIKHIDRLLNLELDF
jgi:hypothetical protein